MRATCVKILVICDMEGKNQTCLIILVMNNHMLRVCGQRKHFAYGLLLKRMRLSSKLKFKMADSDDDEEKLLLFVILLPRRRRRVRALSQKT